MATKIGSDDIKISEFTFNIGVDGKPESPIEIKAYLFTSGGELIGAAPIKEGAARFDLELDDLHKTRLLIGPAFPKERGDKPTISALERLNAYEPMWKFERGLSKYDLGRIPGLNLKWWLWCQCVVRGKIVKPATPGPVSAVLPVCDARVHICEVDRFPWIIKKLPDVDLWRLRDDLLAKIQFPIPMPDPVPFPPDPRFIDPVRPVFKFDAIGVVGRADAVALNPQPLPPKELAQLALRQQVPILDQLDPTLKASLFSDSAPILREALSINYKLILPWLCHWPWVWPYFYNCDEVAVVTTDNQGRFEASVWYPCAGDQPDLYFWVEYSIGGVWETVYRPRIACHTWWNFVCGSTVTITVSDLRVPGCIDVPVVLGRKVVIKTIGRNISMGEILGVPAGTDEGLHVPALEGPGRPSPFGATLEPRVDFGNGITPAVATHYRWSYRRLPSVSEADWRVLDARVARHYRELSPPGAPVVYKDALVGPDDTITGGYFFKIRPALPSGGEDWEVLDERFDLASAYFETGILPLVEHGRHELKLELFKPGAGGAMERVDLTAAGVELYEISDPAPLTAGTYVTTTPGADRQLTVPGIPAPHLVGYRVVLHIDNRLCFGTINEETLPGGVGAGRCGFLEYHAGDSVTLSFRAGHPANFAWFEFGTVRVSTGLPSASASEYVDAVTVNLFNRSGEIFSKSILVSTLLTENEVVPLGETSCTRAAFAEALRVYALASDGYGRLSGLDAPRGPGEVGIRAFAMTPK